jgi:hypothetical protein
MRSILQEPVFSTEPFVPVPVIAVVQCSSPLERFYEIFTGPESNRRYAGIADSQPGGNKFLLCFISHFFSTAVSYNAVLQLSTSSLSFI